ncbi:MULTISPECIES: N-acetylglucosamine kinase [unclassified Streptomyces]|uniref:N-acetylglucosamine kinase n=1 Tax=unclassified Streptomyces TaxID=2593676 RepID=UPI00278C3A9B|nr:MULTISPECIES: BadF/BadG/BcrA/BcrD ATPase family protein [unclassified Streptomyces]
MYLGVDGGGTKTAFTIVDASGAVLAEAEGPSTSPAPGEHGMDTARTVLREGITAVCRRAGTDPTRLKHAYFGLPAHGESPRLTEALDALPARVLGHDRYAVGNDMMCGWAGSLGLADGVNVISGTGSMAYGVLRGREARTGGWGELFGDEGSGYWIAVQGLNLFSRMSDGRMPPGPLHALLRSRLALDSDLELVDVMLLSRPDRTSVAALSRYVSEAAADGDARCARILARAGEELAALARAARHAVAAAPEETVPVSWSGGVFTEDRVREAFTDALAAYPEPYDIRPPRDSPAVGAALLAARFAGDPVTQ